VLGAAGQHRRIYNYEHFPELSLPWMWSTRHFIAASVCVMLAFQLVFFLNLILSLRSGKKAGKNPWEANTLEWSAESPPPHGNWPELPRVYRGPYEYSVPGRKQDYWPQNEPA
jgi:cytochrome c oxidase subunit 1